MPLSLRARRALVLGVVTALPACATINATVDPWAREAGVTAGAPVVLYGKVGSVTVYREGDPRPLKVVMIANPTLGQSIGNAMRQSAAQSQANRVGSATYTETMRWSPAVYLRQKQTHRLLVVREDGRQAVVVAQPHVAAKYLVIDWLLMAPSFFTSVLVDWGTGKWQVFDPINVDALFLSGGKEDGAAAEAPAPDATVPVGDEAVPVPSWLGAPRPL